jgi:hypothetical protein
MYEVVEIRDRSVSQDMHRCNKGDMADALESRFHRTVITQEILVTTAKGTKVQRDLRPEPVLPPSWPPSGRDVSKSQSFSDPITFSKKPWVSGTGWYQYPTAWRLRSMRELVSQSVTHDYYRGEHSSIDQIAPDDKCESRSG